MDSLIPGATPIFVESEHAVFFSIRTTDPDRYFRTAGSIRPFVNIQGILKSYIGFHCSEIAICARIFVCED